MIAPLMQKHSKLVVGLMSGTSLDGIDAAIVKIEGEGTESKVELLHFMDIPYEDELREKLKELCSEQLSDTPHVCGMNFYLGHKFADAVKQVVGYSGLALSDIDLISSHGQTIWHIPAGDPVDPFLVKSTLQIGDLSVIAKETGIITIGDYRTADMALGGQGAPLTPYADFIMFRHPDKGRIVQNIGGIGNCASLPAGARPEQVVAFDTGPGNMIIDQAAYELSGGARTFDRGGAWAAEGQVNESLLAEMLKHPYLDMKPVKTTGREMFGKQYAAEWIGRAHANSMASADILATFTAFTAHTIAKSYQDFILPQTRIEEVIVSGGGAHNRTLLGMLALLLPEQKILSSNDLGVSSDAKEAIAFAIFANNYIHGQPNNLPSATGAERPAIMGKMALPW
jgi:anhydro-N-acetylmuramic acid kinase